MTKQKDFPRIQSVFGQSIKVSKNGQYSAPAAPYLYFIRRLICMIIDL